MKSNTIAAIATPMTNSGIGIIRISGDEALDIIEKVKPRRAFLTHISHQLGLHKEVSAELPPNVFLAYDNLTIDC